MAQKTVAVKKLKEDDMDLKTDLLKEAEVHNKMRHKRIVSLIGGHHSILMVVKEDQRCFKQLQTVNSVLKCICFAPH